MVERIIYWVKVRNVGFVVLFDKIGDSFFIKFLGNNFFYNIYVRSGGMINKYVGI